MAVYRDGPHDDLAIVNSKLRYELRTIYKRQTPDREQFRSAFIIAAIGARALDNGLGLAGIITRAKEAEEFVFGALPEEGQDEAG